jgi:hypothetical protein
MRRTIAFLTLFVLIPFVAEAQEQEEELPRGLFVSQWQCPQNQIQWISQMYDSLSNPIEQELVNEGMPCSSTIGATSGTSIGIESGKTAAPYSTPSARSAAG